MQTINSSGVTLQLSENTKGEEKETPVECRGKFDKLDKCMQTLQFSGYLQKHSLQHIHF